jgi:hypothetical protein
MKRNIISNTEIFAIRILECIQKKYGLNLQECYAKWAIAQLSKGMHSTKLSVLATFTAMDNFFE